MSLMTYSYGRSPIAKDPTFAIALGFYTGLVQLGMWVIGIGEWSYINLWIHNTIQYKLPDFTKLLLINLGRCLAY